MNRIKNALKLSALSLILISSTGAIAMQTAIVEKPTSRDYAVSQNFRNAVEALERHDTEAFRQAAEQLTMEEINLNIPKGVHKVWLPTGFTLLILATAEGNLPAVLLLLTRNASKNIVDDWHRTATDLAHAQMKNHPANPNYPKIYDALLKEI